MGFLYVGQADLKLLTSGDLPASVSQSAEITGVSHRTQPNTKPILEDSVEYLMQFVNVYWMHIAFTTS